jgi:hypothetical protein
LRPLVRRRNLKNMDASYPDIWIRAIKEVLAEDGQPPLSVDDESKVRADIERMNAERQCDCKSAA